MQDFDEALLRESAELIGRDGLCDVAKRYLDLADDLAAAARGTDLTLLCEAAHAVAGCAKYLGMPRLGLGCREVMAACRAGDAAAAAREVAPLLPLLDQTRAWLEGALARISVA